MDRLRDALERHPQIHLEDTPQFYDIGVFNRYAQTRNVMITVECRRDIHLGLVTLPVDWNFQIPYGLMYAKDPPEEVLKLLSLVRALD